MKKSKLALISMLVFMAVFSLTVIFNLQIPFISTKGNSAKLDSVSTKSDALADDTQEMEIQSFSYDAGSQDTFIANEVLSTIEDSNTLSITPTVAPTEAPPEITTPAQATPTPVPAQYANIGISIAGDYVNIREKASADSSSLGKLYKDSAAEIIKTKGDWYYIESGSVKGYVKSEFLKTGLSDDELISKYGILSISVAVDGLNVRTKPDMDAKKVTVVYMNEIYPVVKTKGEWIKIKIPDENVTGYVKSEFAEVLIEFKEAVSEEEEAKLKQLEAEKQAKEETETKQTDAVSYDVDELKLLACLIQAEAGNQSYECKLAVANVVLNRIQSSKYPDSMKSVIYQSGQFSVAASGSLQKQLDNYDNYSSSSQRLTIKAAKDALGGSNNIGSRLYFNSYKAAVNKGYDHKSTAVKLGGLLFW